ncbi:MAG: ABC transporter permease [Candidatus Aminicenantes bacterium]|nr:ABC transporter permease [Candidatus Aminicenantes bacterium]MDH5715012.1 ABC transporter permease [Candidatus Aminicenantes bacterium]
MPGYIQRRLLLLVPVVWGVVTVVFSFIHLVPGDPVLAMVGENAQPADIARLRQQLGLNDPLHVQYFRYLAKLVRGDLGVSLHTGKPVIRTIIQRYPATIELALASLLLALIISIPLGVLSATKRNSPVDHFSMVLALLGISMPNFWLGPLLIILFSIKLNLLPVSGSGGLSHLILPAITLGTAMTALLTRMVRASMLEVMGQDYIRTARAKGLPERVVIYKHALKNALIPVVTIVGLQFGTLLTGAIITETIFAWPGLGRLTIQSISRRDYPLVQGCILMISLTYILVNLATDLLYTVLDPRIRYQR